MEGLLLLVFSAMLLGLCVFDSVFACHGILSAVSYRQCMPNIFRLRAGGHG